jgi:hypothetical protein
MKRVAVGLLLTAGAGIAAGAAWRTRRPAEPGHLAADRPAARADAPGRAVSQEAVAAADALGVAPGETSAPTAVAPATPDPAAAAADDTGALGRAAASAASRALPWLHNFAATAASAEASAQVVDRMARWRAPDPDCSAAAYGGLAIAADVAPAPGTEEVLASYAQGVLVLDAGGRVIASAPAPGCQGSADDLEAVAAGDAQLDGPVIALAATGGGHRASSTWLGLYRVVNGAVAPIFAGVVEDRVGDRTRTGGVTLLPGALLYRAPSGGHTLWVYRPEQHRYVQQALVLPPSA